jgi:hypothetical protein
MVLAIIFVILIGGIIISLKQKKKNTVAPMLFSIILVSFSFGFLSMFVVDKYTKHVKLYKLKHTRLINVEKAIYSGVVKNTGKYTIGEVTLDLKLVNRGKRGSLSTTTFYKNSGFLDFFNTATKTSKGANSIHETFVVAKNLKPKQIKSFRIMVKLPAKFTNVSEHAKVYGH